MSADQNISAETKRKVKWCVFLKRPKSIPDSTSIVLDYHDGPVDKCDNKIFFAESISTSYEFELDDGIEYRYSSYGHYNTFKVAQIFTFKSGKTERYQLVPEKIE